MLKSFLLALSLTVATGSAMAQSDTSTQTPAPATNSTAAMKPSSATEDFVKNASIGNQFEIESSRVALEQARSDEVKRFAQRMVDDHGKAGAMLAEMAQKEGMAAPKVPELDSKHTQMLQKIRSAGEGAQFDRAYVDAQVAAHKEAVNLFRDYSQNGDNANLKNFAQTTLPTLEDHLRQIEDLQRAQVGSAG
jgi:putative membrane protein